MIKLAQNSRECQEHRLKIKTLNQRMQNVAVHGMGLSQEDMAEILMCDVRTIRRDIESLRPGRYWYRVSVIWYRSFGQFHQPRGFKNGDSAL